MPVEIKRPPSSIERIAAGAKDQRHGGADVVFTHGSQANGLNPVLHVSILESPGSAGPELSPTEAVELAQALAEWANSVSVR